MITLKQRINEWRAFLLAPGQEQESQYLRPREGSALAMLRGALIDPVAPALGSTRRFANITQWGADAVGIDTFGYSTDQKHPLGTIAITTDGRMFRYCAAGALPLVAGNVVQTAAVIPLHLALTAVPTTTIGGDGAVSAITVTPGATAGPANLYAEGTLVVDTAPDLGGVYKISGHPAITASVPFSLFLAREDGAGQATQANWSAATRYGLHHNPWKNVIQAPVAPSNTIAGVAVCNIPAANYGWVQTKGPGGVLVNGAPGVQIGVCNGATTPGSVDVITATNLVTSALVGYMNQLGVTTKVCGCKLALD